MTCRQAQKRLADSIYAADPGAPDVRAHLEACEQCARAYAETRAALAAIEPPLRIQASPDFKERVMNEIAKVPTPAPRRRFLVPKMAFAAAAAVALVLLLPSLGSLAGRRGKPNSAALNLLAQSAAAMSNLQSVHITARMRTAPHDNFEFIDPALDWVPLEIWKQFGEQPRWRVEKPERVAVMDGTSSLMLIRQDSAVRGGVQPGFLEWLSALLDTGQLMENELQVASAQRFTSTVTEEVHNSAPSLVVTVHHTLQRVLKDDWLLNKFVGDSDHTRTYRFDAATKRLVALQVVVHTGTADVSVFEITGVRYNEPLDPALFKLELPANVSMYVGPEKMPIGTRGLPQSPRQTAELFFDSCARENWEELLVVYPKTSVPERTKQHMGGIQVISIGTPFQSGLFPGYPGWFVPYEIKFKSGAVKKFNLAVRNDNPAKRWVVDGGY